MGPRRLERGRNAFKAAKDLAERRGWEFRWRLVEADGVGQVAAEMFKHPKCDEAERRSVKPGTALAAAA